MNRKWFGILSGCSILLFSLMVIMGTIKVVENTMKYGFSYEVITITDGEETRTTMTVWVNVAFLFFLSLVIYLLTLPLVYPGIIKLL